MLLFSHYIVSFWKDVKKLNSSSILLATKVGDVIGNRNITHLWQEHFSTLLNGVQNTDSREFVSEHIEHIILSKLPVLYTVSIKYLGYTFSSNNYDDNDILKQIRMLYCRSNRLVRLFSKCSKPLLLEL